MTPDLLPERLRSRIVVQGDGCWAWLAGRTAGGYGCVRVDGRQSYTHRVVYELLVGQIPKDLQIDHLCRVRHCVNPAHLEPVTGSENVRRSPIHPSVLGARKTHCKRGHEFTPENIYHHSKGRRCRACAIAAMRVYDARRRQRVSS